MAVTLTILQLVPALRGGGVETGAVDMAKALVAKGHRAIVISSGGPLAERIEAAGAIHYTLPIHKKLPWVILPMIQRITEVVESHGVDVIHARSRVPAIIGYFAWRRVVRKASFRLGDRTQIPCFITTAHGYYATHFFSRVMGWGRLVIAISERIARHMIDNFGVPAERIRLIPRGVEVGKFVWKEPRLEAPKGQWNVGIIGRISPIKGHRELLRAFSIVAKNFPRAKLWIIGEASADHEAYLKELHAIVERLELKGKVEFTGHEANVEERLSHLDLAVVPSIGQEAFGRVLIEAGAAGVPVVATTVGGMGEVVVDRKTGLLVPPGDPIALASALTMLLKDRELAVELSRQARRRVETVFPLPRMVEQTVAVYKQCAESLRILVIKISAIGDIVLVTPSLRALRERFPKAHITVLVGREGRELIHRCPYADELVVFDRERDGTVPGLLKLGKRLRKAQVDVVVDFQNNRTSHWLGVLSGAPQRYGYAGRQWSWLLTNKAFHPKELIPPVEHQFHLLKLLGIEKASTHLELWPGQRDQSKAGELLHGSWVADAQPLVVIHPGTHPKWISKRWPLDRYAQLADRLASETKARVVITGSPDDRVLAEEIYKMASIKPIMAVGMTTLNELTALIAQAQVFVSGDTAPLHLAAAAGTPLVALFGSTDPKRHMPPSHAARVLKKDIACSPCYRGTCYRKGAGYMECMKLITVDEVAEAVISHWRSAPREVQPS